VKHLTGLSLIIGLLGLPIPAQAQVLTLEAADCALGMIVFKASAVTGLNLTVTPEMLPTWRSYLAYAYPMLPDRYSIANACWELNNKATKWPRMAQVEREMWQNTWAASLPQDLALIEPLFPAAAQQLLSALNQRAAEQIAARNPDQSAIGDILRRWCGNRPC
jgi:hypothetical protein